MEFDMEKVYILMVRDLEFSETVMMVFGAFSTMEKAQEVEQEYFDRMMAEEMEEEDAYTEIQVIRMDSTLF